MAEAPGRVRGLCHVALRVRDVRAAAAFYREHFDMRVVWSPDPENVYLSSGHDNLALHQAPDIAPNGALDHLGFLVDSPDQVPRPSPPAPPRAPRPAPPPGRPRAARPPRPGRHPGADPRAAGVSEPAPGPARPLPPWGVPLLPASSVPAGILALRATVNGDASTA